MNYKFIGIDPESLIGGFESMDLEGILNTYVPKPMLGHPFEMKIRPGCYVLDEAISKDHIPNPTLFESNEDDICVIRSQERDDIRRNIGDFWSEQLGENCEKLGILHKSGLILWGPPGSGKTTILKEEIREIASGDGVVFVSRSPYALSRSMRVFRELEPDRGLTVVMEDIDEICRNWGEHELLEMLDGVNTPNHCFFIATTNDLGALSPKLRRPGRFDRKVEIPNPGLQQRYDYISQKAKGMMTEANMERAARLMEGMSFGHLRNLVLMTCGYRRPLEESVKMMRRDMLVESKKRRRGARPEGCESKYSDWYDHE